MNSYLRTFTLLSAALALGGCVVFQNIPNVPVGCDTRLTGHWHMLMGDTSQSDVEIDRQCRLLGLTNDHQAPLDPIPFRTLTVNGVNYAAFTPAAVDILLSDKSGTFRKYFTKRQVFLARYTLQGELLLIDASNPDYVKQAIRARQIKGKNLEEGLYELNGSPAAISDLLKKQPAIFGIRAKQPEENQDPADKADMVFQRISSTEQP